MVQKQKAFETGTSQAAVRLSKEECCKIKQLVKQDYARTSLSFSEKQHATNSEAWRL
jgi:hypothetical protein